MILKTRASKGASSAGGSPTSPRRSRIDALDRRNVQWRGKIVDHRVEQRLDALVLERGAADDGRERRPTIVARGARAELACRRDGRPRGTSPSSTSSSSAIASTSFSRTRRLGPLPGISSSPNSAPSVSSWQPSAFIVSKVDDAVEVSALPRAAASAPAWRRALASSSRRSARSRRRRGPSC